MAVEIKPLGGRETIEAGRLIQQLSPGEVATHHRAFDGVAKYPFILMVDGEPVGHGAVIIEEKPSYGGSRAGYLEDIVIDERYRGEGYGRQIIDALVSHARHLGCRKVNLSCAEHNVGFYEKCGFHRHEVTMRMDLE